MTSTQFSVGAALDKYVAANANDHPYDGLWHPSAISGCQRKAVYEMRQTPTTDPQTPKQARVLFAGQVWHTHFQAAVAAHGGVKAVHTEVKVSIPELNTTGSGDQLVIFEDDTSELQEFKTIAQWGFQRIQKEKEPKADHLEQVPPYMFGLREYGGIDQDGIAVAAQGDALSRVRFTYIEKQTLDIEEIVVGYDPGWEPELREKIATLNSYLADDESLPPRLPMVKGKKSYMCDWGWGKCPFYTRCWNQDAEEQTPEF